MPSLNDMLNNMELHKNFYIRGVLNSLLPEFANPTEGGVITEKNVSGEAIEFLRSIAQEHAPDLQDGQVKSLDSYDMWFAENLGGQPGGGAEQLDQLSYTLGRFGLTKENGQYVVFDTYDFSRTYGVDNIFQAAQKSIQEKDPYMLARYMGYKLMPENPDGSSRDDALRIRIAIPNEPQIQDALFEEEPEPDASEHVFRGPMTPQRYSLWKTFSGQG